MVSAEKLIEIANKLRINVARIQKANQLPKAKDGNGNDTATLENPKYEEARQALIEESYEYCGELACSATLGFVSPEEDSIFYKDFCEKLAEEHTKAASLIEEGNVETFSLWIIKARKELRSLYRNAGGYELIAYREAFDKIEDILLGYY